MKKTPVLLIVAAEVSADKEKEFNEWYNAVHIKQALKAPGIVRAERYQLIGSKNGLPKYLAVYELENEEAIKAWEESPEREAAVQDRLKVWGETGFTIAWRGYYKRIWSQDK